MLASSRIPKWLYNSNLPQIRWLSLATDFCKKKDYSRAIFEAHHTQTLGIFPHPSSPPFSLYLDEIVSVRRLAILINAWSSGLSALSSRSLTLQHYSARHTDTNGQPVYLLPILDLFWMWSRHKEDTYLKIWWGNVQQFCCPFPGPYATPELFPLDFAWRVILPCEICERKSQISLVLCSDKK